MINARSILKYSFFLLLFILCTGSGCATAKKGKPPNKKDQALCDLSRLGRNKYYYSGSYQRQLHKTERKIKGR
jgi:hypothetical protein